MKKIMEELYKKTWQGLCDDCNVKYKTNIEYCMYIENSGRTGKKLTTVINIAENGQETVHVCYAEKNEDVYEKALIDILEAGARQLYFVY